MILSSAQRGRKRKREKETPASFCATKRWEERFSGRWVTDKMSNKGKEEISRISDSGSLGAEVTPRGLPKE